MNREHEAGPALSAESGRFSRQRAVFRLRGLSCADCAQKLERAIAEMPGVAEVQVNFGASKLTLQLDGLPSAAAFLSLGQDIVATARDERVDLAPEGAVATALIAVPTTQPAKSSASAVSLAAWLQNPMVWMAAASGLAILSAWSLDRNPAVPDLWSRALYAAAILLGGWDTLRSGVRNLLKLKFTTSTLMTVAVTGAGFIDEWAEAAVVAFLFGISELLERASLDRARNAIRALMDLAPPTASVIRDGQEVQLPVEQVRIGDRMVVRPGGRIAMDGIVKVGSSAVNQSAITGESMPVQVEPGSEVLAGSLNGPGFLEIAVTRLAEDTTMAKIIHLVEQAQAQRAPAQKFVDRFAAVYTPVVMILALLIALVPPILFAQPWGPWVYRALALLVVSCPCALVVSTPVSLVSGIGNGARHGVLLKGGAHLEALGTVRAVAFDKTGTLTVGEPRVTDVVAIRGGAEAERELLRLAAAVEVQSEHPLAQAIVAEAVGLDIPTAADFKATVGRGASAEVDGERVDVGSPKFVAELGVDVAPAEAEIERLRGEGKTAVLVAREGRLVGLLGVADELRPEAAQALARLHSEGISRLIMLTGDNRRTAEAIARRVGLTDVRAELLPDEKSRAVTELRGELGAVAMVGDGVNDAPALASSTVGVAMGGATNDVALETADVVLMSDDLAKLPYAVRLSRATMRVIRQNVSFSLGIKLLAVALVFPGWLTLWLAILADMGATILVTANAMRLLKVRP